MSEIPDGPRKAGSLKPWLLGCGLVLLAGLVGLFAAGWYWLDRSVMTDPARVTALAEQIAPGARPPAGAVPKWGVDTFGYQMAVYGPETPLDPKQGEDLIGEGLHGMVYVLASGPRGEGRSMREQMRAKATEQDVDFEQLGREQRTVGGVQVEFEKSRSTQQAIRILHYSAELSQPAGRTTFLMVLGPEKQFDHDAMAAFLAGIRGFGGGPGAGTTPAGGPGQGGK